MQLLETAAHVIGSMLLFVAAAMGFSALVAVIRGEFEVAGWITIAAAITTGAALAGRSFFDRPATITVSEGFVTVGLSWFVFSLFGSLPYVLTGAIPSFTDAFFETASGFTTTGSSILSDPSALPIGIGFWILGYPVVLGFCALQALALAAAFIHQAIHALDGEELVLAGETLEVRTMRGFRSTTVRLNACWTRLECSADADAPALCSGRTCIPVAVYLAEAQRRRFAADFNRVLARVRTPGRLR